jgi:hypothetical protein
MGHHEVVIHLKQYQLIPQTRFALTQGVDSASDRRDPLADVEVESLHKGGIHTTWKVMSQISDALKNPCFEIKGLRK